MEPTKGENILKSSQANADELKTMKHIKKLYAEIIDTLDSLPPEKDPSEKMRLIKIAIEKAEGACMWANKAVAWKK